MRAWETEQFVLNLQTGEMERSITSNMIVAINFEQAQVELLKLGSTSLRLTGSWFKYEKESQEEVYKLEPRKKRGRPKSSLIDDSSYDEAKELKDFLSKKSYDDFLDWIANKGVEELDSLLTKLKKTGGLDAYVRTIEGYINHKYGGKKD